MILHARIVVRGALLFGALAGNPVAAQESPRSGVSVEARIVGPDDPLLGHLCFAVLGAVVGDTLLLEHSKNCAAGNHVAHVRYSPIDPGIRLKHAGLGMLIGAVAGGLIGRATAACRIDGCDKLDARSMNVVTGVMAGSAAGMLVGVAWPVRERWTDLGGERLIRVGSFDFRPAIRVSLDALSR